MQNTVNLETVNFETITFEPRTVHPNIVPAAPAMKPRAAAPLLRTLARKWEMIAVLVLMFASTAYGIDALFFLTGF